MNTGDVDRFLDAFAACADHVTAYYLMRPSVKDPDDEMFAELAVNGRADALVSFNISDYGSSIRVRQRCRCRFAGLATF